MYIVDDIYFYEGDYLEEKGIYKGYASSNFVILPGKEQITFDIGCLTGKHTNRLFREMSEEGINIYRTKHLLLTHSHPDHITGAHRLLRKKALELWIHEEAEKYLFNKYYQLFVQLNLPEYIRKEIYPFSMIFMKLVLNYTYNHTYFRPHRLFSSNDTLTINDRTIQVIPTFGHCKGHVSFYLPASKVLILGDVFSFKSFEGVLVSNSDSSFQAGLDNIDELLKLDIEILLPGHGPVISGKKNVLTVLHEVKKNSLSIADSVLEKVESEGEMTLTEIYNTMFDSIFPFKMQHLTILYQILWYLRQKKQVYYEIRNKKCIWKVTKNKTGNRESIKSNTIKGSQAC